MANARYATPNYSFFLILFPASKHGCLRSVRCPTFPFRDLPVKIQVHEREDQNQGKESRLEQFYEKGKGICGKVFDQGILKGENTL